MGPSEAAAIIARPIVRDCVDPGRLALDPDSFPVGTPVHTEEIEDRSAGVLRELDARLSGKSATRVVF